MITARQGPALRRATVLAALLLNLPAGAAAQGETCDHADPAYVAAAETGRRLLRGLVERGEVAGVAAAVAVRGRVVWAGGFGSADLEHGVPATACTRFGLGSISKTLTAAGALSLVDDGILDLDAPVERYIAGFPFPGRGVTLRRVIAHQSGLSDAFAAARYTSTEHFPTVDSAYRGMILAGLSYEPGSRLEYATGVYTVVAKAMEAAAGQSYPALLRERVFAPAGMTEVAENDPTALVPGRTGFYVRGDDGTLRPAPLFDPSHKLAGAGWLASARDVARFGVALLRPGLLGDSARADMFRPVPLRDGTATDYALGLRVGEVDGRPVLHLPGGGPGISTWLVLHPADAMAVAILSNVTGAPVGGRILRAIASAFRGTAAAGRP